MHFLHAPDQLISSYGCVGQERGRRAPTVMSPGCRLARAGVGGIYRHLDYSAPFQSVKS